jgi:hypothetical protein
MSQVHTRQELMSQSTYSSGTDVSKYVLNCEHSFSYFDPDEGVFTAYSTAIFKVRLLKACIDTVPVLCKYTVSKCGHTASI